MLTPQEVSSHVFSKTVVGGYNMGMVDEFLDELTDDYTAIYKENAALKAKMKVLVEKVEEYRATEDSMRATLLAAQKMADTIIHDAETQKEQILNQAESAAQAKIIDYRRELNAAEIRLNQGRQEMSKFIAAGRELCARELQFLDALPQMKVDETEEAAAEEPAEEPKEVSEEEAVPTAEETAPAEEPVAEPENVPAEETVPAEEKKDNYTESNPFADDSLDATRRIDLDELKFGRNYNKNF